MRGVLVAAVSGLGRQVGVNLEPTLLSYKLAPHLLGPIATAAYSYMALVPIIQPPIMRL